MPSIRLLEIDEAGFVTDYAGVLSETAESVLQATKAFYSKIGFRRPWISYVAECDGRLVGCCSFKSQPHNGSVEIAYFTFPDHEGRGVATFMAGELTAIARSTGEDPQITAQTLPDRNASHRVLEKLGLLPIGVIDHPEDGPVLEWRLPRD